MSKNKNLRSVILLWNSFVYLCHDRQFADHVLKKIWPVISLVGEISSMLMVSYKSLTIIQRQDIQERVE